MNDPGTSLQNPIPVDPRMPICSAMTSKGTPCQRLVKAGAKQCWQHSRGLRQKWRSLTRNQSMLFVCALTSVIGFVLALLAWRYPQVWSNLRPTAAVRVPTAASTQIAKEAQPSPGSDATEPKKAIHKGAKAVPPSVQVNSEPNGIAIGGGS